jgi:hypothetical protein
MSNENKKATKDHQKYVGEKLEFIDSVYSKSQQMLEK